MHNARVLQQQQQQQEEGPKVEAGSPRCTPTPTTYAAPARLAPSTPGQCVDLRPKPPPTAGQCVDSMAQARLRLPGCVPSAT